MGIVSATFAQQQKDIKKTQQKIEILANGDTIIRTHTRVYLKNKKLPPIKKEGPSLTHTFKYITITDNDTHMPMITPTNSSKKIVTHTMRYEPKQKGKNIIKK